MNSTAGAHLVSGEERPKSTTGTRRGRALEWLWHRLSRMPADVALIVAASLICEQTHDYFVLALIALLAVSARGRMNVAFSRLARHPRTALALLAAWGIAAALSLVNATYRPESVQALRVVAMEGFVCLLALLIVDRLETARRLLWMFVLLGILTGTISVIQYATGTFERTYLGFARTRFSHIVGRAEGFRLAGPVGDPNYYAQFLLMLIAIAFAVLVKERHLGRRFAAVWALATCNVALFLTFSRGGFLVFCIMLLLFAATIRRPRWLGIALVAAMLLPCSYLIPRFWNRVETFRQFDPARRSELLQEPGFRGRLSENLVALRMFGDHPILGAGIGNYRPLYQQYAQPLGIDPRTIPRRAHNMYLEIAAETGLVGAVPFVIFLFVLFYALRDAYRKMKPDEATVVFACGLAFAAYLLSSLFLSRILATSLLFWTLAGMGLALPGAMDGQLRHDASSA